MAKLDRYIGTQVLFAILAVLGIILGLALLFAIFTQVNMDGCALSKLLKVQTQV